VLLPRLELEGAGHIAEAKGGIRDRRRRDFMAAKVTVTL
jgi:hypothetical protein